MQPFEVPEAIRTITASHPEADAIILAVQKGGVTEVEAIARQWLSEGIPYAYKEVPGLYEVLREWIANRLDIHGKELTLVGSARQGCSLAPPPKLGKRFNHESDLDWAAISERLFYRCADEFNSWSEDFKKGVVLPRSTREKEYWDDNLLKCPETIRKGFVDPNKIPTWNRYPLSQLIANTMWLTHAKSAATKGAPQFKKSTLRVYRDWLSFIGQLRINLTKASKG